MTAPEPGAAVSAERWREIQRVVDGALDRPTNARAAFIDEVCGSDAALRDDVARLVRACERVERGDGLLGAPAIGLAEPVLAALAAHDRASADERRAALAAALQVALAGRYAVERELGRGGMATVFLAHDVRHERAVAVKVVERTVASAGAERFLHEIRTAARLTHPHVLGVHDSGEADGLLYYVMPYVDGETLRTRLAREGTLPLPDAVRLLRELAGALAYAHARGVVHRDLKPENVLLADGHAVIADFGIAKALAAAARSATAADAHLTGDGVALGTPAYMAPEQAAGDPATDHRADLYALGVVAYEALAGAHPFAARTPRELVVAHRAERPVPLGARRPDAPPALAGLVMRLLAKDPAERPPSAEAVLRVLDGASADTANRASPGRRRVLLAAAAVLAGATLGGLALRRTTGAGAAPGPVAVHTLAVLPFVNTSGTTTDDYFSDGLTDELAHALARLPGLRLAGRTSTYTFKGKAVAAQAIGRALGVDAYVSATIRRSGDRLRVTPQLVSTADGAVLWDSVYESRAGDVFAVQDSLTHAIVAALGPALRGGGASGAAEPLGADAARGTTDANAYDLYLKGRYYWLARDSVNIARAVAYFRQAVARDPAFARAHASLAISYAILPVYIPDPTDSATALNAASARRALALDSTLADAQIALGLALERRLRFPDAQARYRAALAAEPSNVMGHHALGMLLLDVGRTDDGLAELRQAVQLDPLAKSASSAFALALVLARRFPEAVAASRRTLAIDSTFSLAAWGLGLAQAFGGHPDSAVRTLERGARLHPDSPGQRAALLFAYAAAGRWSDAARMREALRRPGGDPSGGADAAFAELVFGDRDPMVRLLSTEAGRLRWYDANFGFGCNPLLDPLWADARFRATMRELAVAPCTRVRPWPLPARPGT